MKTSLRAQALYLIIVAAVGSTATTVAAGPRFQRLDWERVAQQADYSSSVTATKAASTPTVAPTSPSG